MGRVRDSSGGNERQLHWGSSLRTVEEERSLPSAAGSRTLQIGQRTELETPRFTNGLLESAVSGSSCDWQRTDTGEGAGVVGKVTNYGNALLTKSLQTARNIQSHFFTLDAIIDQSQCTCPPGCIPVPRSGAVATARENPSMQHNQRQEQLQ